jgi:hypothetical protein
LEKDPRIYAESIKQPEPTYKRCAGIDLGTSTGVAFVDFVPGHRIEYSPILMGQWDLSVGQYDSGILRLVRLKQFLTILNPDLIMYEEVKYDPPQDVMKKRGHGMGGVVARVATAAEFLGALKATLGIWAEEHNVPAHGLAIAAIKKFATGKGNASKVDMIEAANTQFNTAFDTETYEKTGVDNICDAAFCCKMGLEAYSEGMAT